MLEFKQLYRLHDSDEERRDKEGARPVDLLDAARWNAEGYGIFHAVNDFGGGSRRIDALTRLNAWYCELDAGEKAAQRERIKKSPLMPSVIVETKRGFHCYWMAIDASPEHYTSINRDRIIPALGADEAVWDIARILRTPNFLHLKDPADPFQVRIAYTSEAKYLEKQMLAFFPRSPEHDDKVELREALATVGAAENLWELVYELDQRKALQRLSGTDAVNGQRFRFRKTTKGKFNIYVNDKMVTAFINDKGKIGSRMKGGPSVANWLWWYHRDWKVVVQLLKTHFPELFEKEKTINDRRI